MPGVMNVADRMGRLGTESAFEVLARAKALERQGEPVVHLEIGETRGISVSPDEVVVTPGAKPIMFFAIMALVNRGDEVVYPNPGFPIYESVIHFVGGVPVPIPLLEETGFGFDLRELERRVSKKTKLIIINSPENPTG